MTSFSWAFLKLTRMRCSRLSTEYSYVTVKPIWVWTAPKISSMV
ncbi:hypothetical protein [Chitinophaga lutea]|nr:hypothetical protein [Chitinophaga lutea]